MAALKNVLCVDDTSQVTGLFTEVGGYSNPTNLWGGGELSPGAPAVATGSPLATDINWSSCPYPSGCESGDLAEEVHYITERGHCPCTPPAAVLMRRRRRTRMQRFSQFHQHSLCGMSGCQLPLDDGSNLFDE
jgi:hypothetical protein